MTTAALATHGNTTQETRPGRSLEELVDRVIEALFPEQASTAKSVARTVHDARRLRRTGDVDGALAAFAELDAKTATEADARWAFAEWLGLVKRRFGGLDALVYSQGTGRAAALASRDDGTLEVLSVLGMRWRPGSVVSRRSLRGLRPLEKTRATGRRRSLRVINNAVAKSQPMLEAQAA